MTTEINECDLVIKTSDMPNEMRQDALDCATQALEKYTLEKDIAHYIKKEYEKKYAPSWHCIGKNHFKIKNLFFCHTLHTVWKFHDFSIIHILREIKFWGFWKRKIYHFNTFSGSEF